MQIKFAALDPSMSNLGIALGTYYLGEVAPNLGGGTTITDGYEVTGIQLIQTFPSKEKKVRKSALDYERCRQLYIGMAAVLNDWMPTICFAEMPTGSQSASGMKSYGISLMLLGTIGVPVIQVTPAEVKVAAVMSKNASKDTMIKWAMEKWPDLPWLKRTIKGETKRLNKNEHMADACAAVEAGVRTDQWNQLVSVLGSNMAGNGREVSDD